MGDLRPWSPEPNGAVSEERPSSSSSSSSLTGVTDEYWQRAETFAQRIIAQVQPTLVSLQKRKAVIDYVQRLIKNSLGCEVFPFGSVPLKTYLPDGDIDLTAFGGMNVEEALANDVCSVLEREDQNNNVDFVVKDVQLIRAEVKLVKCLVQNIVVDISFNQLGGLCTLCFLEQVDHLIGKDHLFKRSIILIKAWCYYESRILGAHHGLISTYALETLVLYVFHVFHSSLNGPLAVLYKFLDYFSKFDWDNYCISLNGPVRIASLPEVAVEAPENGGCDLLLSSDFLKDCTEMFSVPARGFESNSRTFLPKHLNIVDPLKENNNLGRSVSKGNFYRIRSAFTYGARKLGRILTMPEESITGELSKFFSNTLDRHGRGQRPDVLDPATIDEQLEFGTSFSFSGAESSQEDLRVFEPEYHEQPLEGENVQVSMGNMNFNRTIDELSLSASGPAVSECRVSGDAEDLATSRMQGLSISNDALKSSSPGVEESLSPMGKAHHAPHINISVSALGNGEMKDGNIEWKQEENSGFMEISGVVPAPAEDVVHAISNGLDDKLLNASHEIPSPVGLSNNPLINNPMPWSSEELYPGNSSYQASTTAAASLETLNSLADLSGDYENHVNNLHHGRWWYEYAICASVPSMSSQMLSQFQGKNSWDLIRRSVQFRRNGTSQMNVSGFVARPFFYPMNAPLLPSAAFALEEMQKPRGTGTYFPNTNHYRDRTFTGSRGRNQAATRSPRPNGRIIPPQEMNLSERNYHDHEHPHAQFHNHHGSGGFVSSDLRQNGSLEARPSPNVNGFMHLAERVVEFGPGGHLPPAASTEGGWHPDPASAPTHNSSTSEAIEGIQGPKPIVSIDQNRNSMKSFQLIDENDFPPLSDSSGKGSSVCTVKKHEKSDQ